MQKLAVCQMRKRSFSQRSSLCYRSVSLRRIPHRQSHNAGRKLSAQLALLFAVQLSVARSILKYSSRSFGDLKHSREQVKKDERREERNYEIKQNPAVREALQESIVLQNDRTENRKFSACSARNEDD